MSRQVRASALKWEVVEDDPILDHPWVIARFDVQDDAEAFTVTKNLIANRTSYTVRLSPDWESIQKYGRELRRDSHASEMHAEIEVG